MNAVVGSAMAYFFLPFQYFMLFDTLQKSTPERKEKAPSKARDFARLRDFTDTFRNTVPSNSVRLCDMGKKIT